MIEELYPIALDIGIKPYEFDNYSIQEVYDLISSHNRQVEVKAQEEKERIELQASMNNILALQIGERVAQLFDKDFKPTPITEIYPELFKEELEARRENEMELYKIKMKDYAYRHNKKIKEGGRIE